MISSATQLTVFTACDLVNSTSNTTEEILESITESYLAWNDGGHSYPYDSCSKYNNWQRDFGSWRYPDAICVDALDNLAVGTDVHNDSKSCGGVVRVAPIALMGLGDNRFIDIYAMDKMAVDTARITHKNPLGYLPALVFAHVTYRLAIDDAPTREKLSYYIKESLSVAAKLYPTFQQEIDYLRLLLHKTLLLAYYQHPSRESLSLLGDGWNAGEAIAMAFYCAIRYFDDFEAALAAVHHIGNRDNIGAIIGNILGAAMGYNVIQEKCNPGILSQGLECSRMIIKVADNLWERR